MMQVDTRAWRSIYHLNDIPNRQVGIPRCVAAICDGSYVLTGSTLLKWASLDFLKLQSPTEWYREARKSRFSSDEQALLNGLVRREDAELQRVREVLEKYWPQARNMFSTAQLAILDNIQSKHDQELINARHDRSAAEYKKNAAKTLFEARSGGIEDVNKWAAEINKAINKIRQLEKDGKQKTQRKWLEPLMLHLYQTRLNRVPQTLRSFYLSGSHAPHIGQAYEGASYAFKRKCQYCEVIYPYPTVDDINMATGDWEHAGEPDNGKNNPDHRGCCAEAIPFVLALKQAGIFVTLCTELGVKVWYRECNGRGFWELRSGLQDRFHDVLRCHTAGKKAVPIETCYELVKNGLSLELSVLRSVFEDGFSHERAAKRYRMSKGWPIVDHMIP